MTGGLGRIGLTVARYLAEACAARLVLTTRAPFPPEAEWSAHEAARGPRATEIAALRVIRALGGDVLVGTADVADAEAMRALVARAEARFGPVCGVVHSAGVLGDGGIRQKSLEELREVLRPKVEGTLVLDALFAGRHLDFFVLFSSLSAVRPGFGQVAYSAANSFLDAFVRGPAARRGGPVTCLSWDVWQGGGMAYDATAPAALQAMKETDFAARGILPGEGVEVFRRVLAAAAPHVMVSTSDYLRTAEVDLARMYIEKAGQGTESAGRHLRPEVATAHAAPETEAETLLAGMWEALLGIDGIGIDDDFFELGADSLIGTQLITRIRGGFGVKLPVGSVYVYRTIRSMAAAVEDALMAATSPAQLAEALGWMDGAAIVKELAPSPRDEA